MNIPIATEENDSTTVRMSQNMLDSLITKHKPNDPLLRINKSLAGPLDFRSLETRNVTKIVFDEQGKVEQLMGLPATLVSLECDRQNLTAVPANLENIETLHLGHNFIEEIDLKKYTRLRVLDVQSNRIKSLRHIPDTIEELYLDNNQIRALNLANLPRLRVLHCTNNGMIRIDNVPPTIVDLRMENGNPHLRADYAFQTKSVNESASSSRALPEVEAEYYENLNVYFAMKTKYEEALKIDRETVKKMAAKKGLSRAQIKSRVIAVRGKCVNCKRRVGTIFKQHDQRYLAYCGDAMEPCALKFELYRGDYMNREEMMEYYFSEMEQKKEEIIRHKMDTLFEYISESKSAEEFKRLATEYRSSNTIYKEKWDEREDVRFGTSKQELVRMKQMKLYELERAMEDLVEAGEMDEFVNTMAKEYIPEKEQLRRIKYGIMEMEESMKTGKYHLVQKPFDFSQVDYLAGEAPRVLQSSK